MAELVDALDLGSSEEIRVGSSPSTPTTVRQSYFALCATKDAGLPTTRNASWDKSGLLQILKKIFKSNIQSVTNLCNSFSIGQTFGSVFIESFAFIKYGRA